MSASQRLPPLTNFGKIFWTNQFRTTIDLPVPQQLPSLSRKVAIITGANTGLGFEAAKQLLCLGLSHLIIAVRSIEKGKLAAALLIKFNPAAKLEVWPLDMESYDSIQDFVRRCDVEAPRIDYTILNAGLSALSFRKVPSTGHETVIQVNHLSTALLTVLLLPILAKKADQTNPNRLTVVNSLTAHLCKFPNRNVRPLLTSFDDTKVVPWDAQERYGVSKLLNQLFLVKLTEQVGAKEVVVNMVDPGLIKGTRLARDAHGLFAIAVNAFLNICGRPVDRGAATYIHALLGLGQESHGCFLMSNQIAPLAGIYYKPEGAAITEVIWEETLQELQFAKVEEVISSLLG